jgi:hypothetical protein
MSNSSPTFTQCSILLKLGISPQCVIAQLTQVQSNGNFVADYFFEFFPFPSNGMRMRQNEPNCPGANGSRNEFADENEKII